MDRKKFLRNGLFGLGAIIALPTVVSSCSEDNDNESSDDTGNNAGGQSNGMYTASKCIC